MNIEEMDVFKLSHSLTIEVYKHTKKYPADEKFGLVSQIRRSASSISMNLIEGSHRNNRNEYKQFVGIAKGSAAELKYQIMLSNDLGYLDEDNYKRLLESIIRILKMLEKLNSALKRETGNDTRKT
ncbi:MAG: four helix bundle protein [bacterium]